MAVATLVQEVPQVGRKWRRPKHSFNLKTKPYDIQPFFIAPVLAGETMKNLLMQSRVVSDPVKNPLMGWWKEYYFFYVKLRDLDIRDQMTSMLLNPQQDVSALRTAADNAHFHPAASINYTSYCLERVVKEYFRDEGKTPGGEGGQIGNQYIAHAHSHDESWLDSLTTHAAMPEYDPSDNLGTYDETLRTQWEFMRAQKLSNMSFEDYLATFGVNSPVEPNKPELIRYLKEWTYPSNTINPTDGKPSSALSWSIQERADKDRFFREPGFLFGVTVTRPKVLLSAVAGSLSHFLDNAFSWLPAIMQDSPETSLRFFAVGGGPAPAVADPTGYYVDLRDLFLYGEQYVNYALSTATDVNKAALPNAAGQFKYMTDAERTAMFTTASANTIREDGIVTLGILGAQVEQT